MNLSLVKQENFGNVQCDFWKNENGDVFMTINQLAQVLDYSSKSGIENMVSRNEYLKNSEFSGTHKLWVGGVKQETRIFTEDGIYEVTMLSKQPKAREFRRWVGTILKGLRKGELKLVPKMDSYMIEDPVQRAYRWAEEYKEKKALMQRVEEYEPKAKYVDQILQSTDTVTITQIAKDYGMSGQALNKILYEEKVQYKQNNQWLLYAKHHDKGYTKSQTVDIVHSDGARSIKLNTRWTQKGRLFIHELLEKRGIVAVVDRRNKEVAK